MTERRQLACDSKMKRRKLAGVRSDLPIDLSFLRRVDLGQLDAFVVEENVHVVEQELVRIGVRHVEAEVVDELLLLFLPLFPTVFTHLAADLLTKLGRNRRETDRLVFLPAAATLKFISK